MNDRIKLIAISPDNSIVDYLQHPDMEIKGEAYDIVSTFNVNGRETLSFSLPLYVVNERGELVENNKWQLVNSTDIKIRVIDEENVIKDFYINNYTESHDTVAVASFECISLAEYELNKIGTNIVLGAESLNIYADTDNPNDPNTVPIDHNEPDIHFWASKVLQNSDWTYEVKSYYEVDTDIETDNRQEKVQPEDAGKKPHVLFVGEQQIYENDRLIGYGNTGDKIESKAYEIKKRILQISKQSIFNLIQEINEKFEVFSSFVVEYDNNGNILNKKIIFRNDIADPALQTIRYNKNLISIQRTLNTDNLVNKMYVNDITNSDSDSGVVSIKTAEKNYSKEGYLMNFDWFLGQAEIDGIQGKKFLTEELTWIKPDTSEIIGAKEIIKEYEQECRNFNIQIEETQEKINKLTTDIYNLKEEYNLELGKYDAALTTKNQKLRELELTPKEPVNVNNQKIFAYYKKYQEGAVERYVLNTPVEGIEQGSLFIKLPNESAGLDWTAICDDIVVDSPTQIVLHDLELIEDKEVIQIEASYRYDTRAFITQVINYYNEIIQLSSVRINQIGKTLNENGTGLLSIAELALKQEQANLKLIQNNKQAIINSFDKTMNPYIKEGYWEDTSYAKYLQPETLVNEIPEYSYAKKLSGETDWSTKTNLSVNVFVIPNEVVIDKDVRYNTYDILDKHNTEVYYKDTDGKHYLYDSSVYKIDWIGVKNTNQSETSATKGLCVWFYRDLFSDPTYLKNETIYIKPKFIGSDKVSSELIELTEYNSNQTLDLYTQIAYLNSEFNFTDENVVINSVQLIYNTYSADILPFGDIKITGRDIYELSYGRDFTAEKIFEEDKIKVKIVLQPTGNFTQYLLNNEFNSNYTIKYQTDNTESFYYNDAADKLKNSCVPNIDYNMNVAAISEQIIISEAKEKEIVTDYKIIKKIYLPTLGSRVLINDSELKIKNIVGAITNIVRNYNNPQNNAITVANYKNRFDDLFERISAATTNIESNAAYYEKATETVNKEGQIPNDILKESLLNNNLILSKTQDNTVTWDEKGIILTDKRKNQNGVHGQVRMTSGGVFVANEKDENGNYIWITGITPEYINADLLKAGTIDTKQIKIYNNEFQRFLWDGQGIHAYKELYDATGTLIGTDFNTFVSYNEDGLIFKRKLEDGTELTELQLGWDGLSLGAQNDVIKLTSEKGLLVSDDTGKVVVQVGTWEEENKKHYGIRGINPDNTTNFSLTEEGLHIDFSQLDEEFSEKYGDIINPNLMKNSAMIKKQHVIDEGQNYYTPDFWLKEIRAYFSESATPPTKDIHEGSYWYCTENSAQYKQGVVYQYLSGEWTETDKTRKEVMAKGNAMKFTKQRSDEESKEITLSNSLIDFSINRDYSHIFNFSEGTVYNPNAKFVTLSCKLKTSMDWGMAYLVLPFLDKDTSDIVGGGENLSSLYEPGIIILKEQFNEFGECTITVPNPKLTTVENGGIFHPATASLTAPSTDKKWFDLNETGAFQGMGNLKEYKDGQWIPVKDGFSFFLENDVLLPDGSTAIPRTSIYTYRKILGAYYNAQAFYNENLSIKTINPVFSLYGSMRIIIAPANPLTIATTAVENRDLYWVPGTLDAQGKIVHETNPRKIQRPLFSYDSNNKPIKCIDWIEIDQTSRDLMDVSLDPTYAGLLNYVLPPSGGYTVGDIKLEYGKTPTMWVPHQSEIYSKSVQIDDNGMKITAGQNTMLIDEDEIVSEQILDAESNTKKLLFKIKEDETQINKIYISEELKTENFIIKELEVNEEEILTFL